MKTDKESLENSLYQLQQDMAEVESRKQQLELDNQELNIRKENLTGKATTVMLSNCMFVLIL